MSSYLRDRIHVLALTMALSFVLGACVQPDKPGVSVTALNADIVFGVKDPAAPGPANTPLPDTSAGPVLDASGPSRAAIDTDEDDLPSQDFGPPTTVKKSFPRPNFESTTSNASDCPPAALNAFPEENAPLNVPKDRLPLEGEYRWKRTGTYETPNALDPSKPVVNNADGFERRLIQKVTKEADDPVTKDRMRYTYEVVQPEVVSGFIATTRYRVDTAAQSAEFQNTLGPERASGGEPERGLVIKNVSRQDAGGNRGPGFAPTTGLLIGPLPIRTGEQFTSVAVDPTTNQSMRYEAQLIARDRVDACGEIIDGWRVEGTLTSSGRTSQSSIKYTTIVAPQLGMIPIYEKIEAPGVNLEYTIGQKVPSAPEPEEGT